jgi:hypothetical protein
MFAHGGTGIILSRGAVLKVLPILDTCIMKYKDCWGTFDFLYFYILYAYSFSYKLEIYGWDFV